MARISVFSDVHGNLPALEAVLEHAGGCDGWWCAGDAVGYGPFPAECVRVVRDLRGAAVAGNHDLGSIGGIGLGVFNPPAAEACLWTAGALGEEERGYLGSLPLQCELDPGAVLVHGSCLDPVWEYVVSAEQAVRALEACPGRVCFHGHTHLPALFASGPGGAARELSPQYGVPLVLEDGVRYMVNAGSVGQPRDGDPRACYVVYDTSGMTVTFQRVEYPVDVTQAAMVSVGLPGFLVERIAHGI